MRKTELIVSGEVIHPKTKASIVAHEHTNVEALLDQQNRTSSTITQTSAMSQVGVGDGEDLSFCVEDGFYESATLYGKTMVNCIQEPSSQDVVLPYEFEDGQYVTINDTKESGALGVELKGQTLVNLYPQSEFNAMYTSRVQVERGYRYTQTQHHDATRIEITSLKNGRFKTNTTYYVQLTTKVNKARLCEVRFENGQVSTITLSANETKVIKAKVSSGQTLQRFFIYFRPSDGSDYVGDTFDILDLVVLEHQDGMENWDIPYFEGMTSCKMPTLHTVGKNLFSREKVEFNKFYIIEGNLDVNNEGTFSEAKGLRCLTLSLPQNENFTFSIGHPTGNLRIFASNEKPSIGVKGKKIFGTQGAKVATFNTGHYKYFTIVYYSYNSDNTSGKTEDETIATIQIEQGTVATTYEPHKSSILSLPEEVVLRSLPNGVCDTFNTRTGVYTQRTTEIILDGSESWVECTSQSREKTILFQWRNTLYSPSNNNKIGLFSDTFMTTTADDQWRSDSESVSINVSASIGVRISKEKVSDISAFKKWLSSNNIRIVCELVSPIVTKINLSSTLKSWNTTTHVYSEIPENTLYPTLTHSNPSYPVILKPSTKYSIVASSYSNSHTNSAINFNLGGATASTTVGNRVTTITTPSTLSNELLTMSGRGNKLSNVMVIEGEVVGDEPYFEGICDCKSPILSNIGKNLFDYSGHPITLDRLAYVDGKPEIWLDYIGIKTYVPVKENTTYTYSNDINVGIYYGLVFYDSNKNVLSNINYYGSHEGIKTFTTPKGCKFIRFAMKTQQIPQWIQIEESSSATPYEPYKSNILSCNGDKIELTEDMFEQGHCGYNPSVIGSTYDEFKSVATPSSQATRVRSKSLVKVKPNTTYFIKADSTKYNFGMQGFDNNKLSIGYDTHWQTDHVFTTPANMCYASLHIRKNNDGNLTPANVDYNCIQLSEVDKTIVLRSLPNGVCDTLNVETGEYVQRIGETTLDGSSRNDLNYHNVMKEQNGQFFRMIINQCSFYNKSKYGNCDKLAFYHTDKTNVPVEGVFPYGGDRHFYIQISTSRISGADSMEELSSELKTAFRDWLQANPIIIQYELATPIVSTIDVQGFPYAYTNGHVQLSSGSIEQSLTPKVEYVVQTNRAGAIQANQDRLLNHDKRLAMLEDLVLHQLIQLEYNRAKCTFLSQTRQIFEGGIQMYHTKYELLSEFIEKKLYRSLEEVFEMLDVYFMLGDITDGEYDALYEALMPSAEEIFEVEETFDHEDVEV